MERREGKGEGGIAEKKRIKQGMKIRRKEEKGGEE